MAFKNPYDVRDRPLFEQPGTPNRLGCRLDARCRSVALEVRHFQFREIDVLRDHRDEFMEQPSVGQILFALASWRRLQASEEAFAAERLPDGPRRKTVGTP